MAIFNVEINSKEVEAIITDLIREYHAMIRERLNINVEYKLSTQPVRIIGGFPESTILASCIPDDDRTSIVEVVFFSESITNMLNSKFKVVNDSDIFFYSVRICILFIIVHELVHIQQIIKGLSINEYFKIHYSDNPWEKEANDKAARVVAEKGVFEQEIVKVSRGLLNLDNENVYEFINLYQK
ncbi:hypothetical protein [Bacillus infantis]|uniref:hypothetical protein n=1 Tax=Bacillus infantis TaxID=324767 RepID=UPI003015BE95